GAMNTSRPVANVDVSYSNMSSGATDRLSALATVAFTASSAEVAQRTNKDVMVAAVETIANENNRLAVKLRDEGRLHEAKKLLIRNYKQVQSENEKYRSTKLDESARTNEEDAKKMDDEDSWNQQRKSMRKNQQRVEVQSSY